MHSRIFSITIHVIYKYFTFNGCTDYSVKTKMASTIFRCNYAKHELNKIYLVK